MKKEEIIEQLKEDEKLEKGEIIDITEKGVEYFDYECSWDDHTIFFRDEKYCTEEELRKIIYVAEESKKYGVTEDYITSILADAYKDCFVDFMTTLRCVAVIHSEDDLTDVFKFANIAEDEFLCLGDNLVGLTIHDAQICLINEGWILESLPDISQKSGFGDEIYVDGIGVTAIHECRHQMFDINFLLSEEKYPISLQAEDEVEEFARFKWDMIRRNHIILNENLNELEDV